MKRFQVVICFLAVFLLMVAGSADYGFAQSAPVYIEPPSGTHYIAPPIKNRKTKKSPDPFSEALMRTYAINSMASEEAANERKKETEKKLEEYDEKLKKMWAAHEEAVLKTDPEDVVEDIDEKKNMTGDNGVRN